MPGYLIGDQANRGNRTNQANRTLLASNCLKNLQYKRYRCIIDRNKNINNHEYSAYQNSDRE